MGYRKFWNCHANSIASGESNSLIKDYHTFIDLREMLHSGFVIFSKRGERYADTIQKGLILRLTGKKTPAGKHNFMLDRPLPYIAIRVKYLLLSSLVDYRVVICHFRPT